MEVHTQLKNALVGREMIRTIINHPSINATLIIIVLNVTSSKPNTCFRCVLDDHFIANFPKLDTLDKKVHWNTEKPKNCA